MTIPKLLSYSMHPFSERITQKVGSLQVPLLMRERDRERVKERGRGLPMSLCLCITEVGKNTKGTVWVSLRKLAGMQSFMVPYSLAYSLCGSRSLVRIK